MSLSDLLPAVGALTHADKLRLLQFLASELGREAGLGEIKAGVEYPVWSPYDAYDAARVLQQALDEVAVRP